MSIERWCAQVIAALLIAIVVLLAFIWHALAHDDGRYAGVDPQIREWVNGLTDQEGHGCCATADSQVVEDVDYDTQADHYRVRIAGQWVDVPDKAVIHGANKLGTPMVWLRPDGVVRCFIPGGGT